jgi:bifunctional UDP-N-acetylglucosamine pyrophosphorylase / glucosamine-1-phosphate N-acetyltransferase
VTAADQPARLRVLLVAGAEVSGAAPALCGRHPARWLLDTARALGPDELVLTGPGAGAVGDLAPAVGDLAPAVGDLAPAVGDLAAAPGFAGGPAPGPVTLVLPCAVPLVQPSTLRRMLARLTAAASPATAVVLAATREAPWWDEPAGPPGYGDRPAPVAVGPAPLADAALLDALAGATAAGATALLTAAGHTVAREPAGTVESLCLLDPGERARAERALYQRVAARWLAAGVLIDDPDTTRIDAGVRLAAGVRVGGHTELLGETVVGPGSRIGPATTLRDCHVGAGCHIRYSVCEQVEIGDETNVGPYCWLRSGSRLGPRTRAGCFVEIADTVLGAGTVVPHMAGLMSADIGEGCNIAGLSGSANFDGVRKQRVRLGDGVSIGAANILVAPVTIGDGARTAAGSVITEDVPGGALGIARAEQRNFLGWAARRPDSPARRDSPAPARPAG